MGGPDLIRWLSIPSPPINDSRIAVVSLPPTGHAGLVRNAGMGSVYTPWIAFVDDDDRLHPDYLLTLQREIRQTPYTTAVVFRMVTEDGQRIPSEGCAMIRRGDVGISFAIHSSVSVRFTGAETEDYLFLYEMDRQRYPMVLSSEVMYAVRRAQWRPSSPMDFPRVVLHPVT